jgi:hypothetical protein
MADKNALSDQQFAELTPRLARGLQVDNTPGEPAPSGARVCVGFGCSIRLPVARDIRHVRSRFVPKTW